MLVAVPIVSVLLALLVGSFFLIINGTNPLEVYTMLVKSAFTTSYGITESFVKAIPLMWPVGRVSGLSHAALEYRRRGSIIYGCRGRHLAALTFPNSSAIILIPFMLILGFLAGLFGLCCLRYPGLISMSMKPLPLYL